MNLIWLQLTNSKLKYINLNASDLHLSIQCSISCIDFSTKGLLFSAFILHFFSKHFGKIIKRVGILLKFCFTFFTHSLFFSIYYFFCLIFNSLYFCIYLCFNFFYKFYFQIIFLLSFPDMKKKFNIFVVVVLYFRCLSIWSFSW